MEEWENIYLRVWLGEVFDLDPSLFALFWLRLLSVGEKSPTAVIKCALLHSENTQCTVAGLSMEHFLWIKCEKRLVPTCFSQPWTVVCNHQKASDSSPWRAWERCRWGRGWSWQQTQRSSVRIQIFAQGFRYMGFLLAAHYIFSSW